MPTERKPDLSTCPARLVYLRWLARAEDLGAPISPRRLSLLADLSAGMVGDIEGGREVKPRTLRAVAEAAGCSEAWLEEGEGKPPTREDVRSAIRAAGQRYEARKARAS